MLPATADRSSVTSLAGCMCSQGLPWHAVLTTHSASKEALETSRRTSGVCGAMGCTMESDTSNGHLVPRDGRSQALRGTRGAHSDAHSCMFPDPHPTPHRGGGGAQHNSKDTSNSIAPRQEKDMHHTIQSRRALPSGTTCARPACCWRSPSPSGQAGMQPSLCNMARTTMDKLSPNINGTRWLALPTDNDKSQ